MRYLKENMCDFKKALDDKHIRETYIIETIRYQRNPIIKPFNNK